MEEYEEPVTIELRNDREVAVAMFSFGAAAPALVHEGLMTGAIVTSNLQHRVVEDDEERVSEALDTHGVGGSMVSSDGVESMSSPAIVSQIADRGEVDPDEATEGML